MENLFLVADQKYMTWIEKLNKKYIKFAAVLVNVDQGKSVYGIVRNTDIPRLTSGTDFIRATAKKYGEVIVAETKECDAELARFASNNPSVIAVFTDDSDFLIFTGNWKYFSIEKMYNLENLRTKEFSRTALRRYLDLDDEQMKLLSTISGNDILKRCNFEIKKKNEAELLDAKFRKIADIIRNRLNIPDF